MFLSMNYVKIYYWLEYFFDFKPAIIGYPIIINGAEFNFHYSFHTIPCIGFSIKMYEKSMYFSGDTFYDPEAL